MLYLGISIYLFPKLPFLLMSGAASPILLVLPSHRKKKLPYIKLLLLQPHPFKPTHCLPSSTTAKHNCWMLPPSRNAIKFSIVLGFVHIIVSITINIGAGGAELAAFTAGGRATAACWCSA